MAKASKFTRKITRTVKVVDQVPGYVELNLTPEEAKAVFVALGFVGGHPERSPRKHTEAVYRELGRTLGISVAFTYNNGRYTVDTFGEAGNQLTNSEDMFSLDDVEQRLLFKTKLTPEEGAAYRALHTKALSGPLTQEDYEQNKFMIDKARRNGLMSDTLQSALDNGQINYMKQLQSTGYLMDATKGQKASRMIDPNLGSGPDLAAKKPVAQTMIASGEIGGALTVMREGVALTAYPDPSNDGSINIGVGYNIDRNIKTAAEDFKAAGIQATVAAVRSGKVSISTEQAVKLYQVTKPKYEAWAKDAFEKHLDAKGMSVEGQWEKLSAPERAVITDMAYQAGKNVGKFHSLFDHLIAKEDDPLALGSALSMTYKDNKTGERKVDEQARNLRLSVLQGRFMPSLKQNGTIN